MKILILTNNDIGLYKFRRELIEELINQNNEVYISLPNGALISDLIKLGCHFIDTPIDRRGTNIFTDLKLFYKYNRIIKNIEPDYIITYTIKPNLYGAIAARLSKTNYAVNVSGLGTAFERGGLVQLIAELLYRISLKRATVVFFENSSNAKKFACLGLCSKKQITVLNGAGVNLSTYSYMDYPTNTKICFLFVGRVMKEKGINELLSSMKRLIHEGYPCVLDVVGPFEENYKQVFSQYESEGWLRYHGYQDDVRPFINKCDCFVLPSYHEGMANTNLECASSGRPVITTNIPGCKEAVIEGISGYLCMPKDSMSLYHAMKKIVTMNTEERKRMGIEGRKHMQKKFEKTQVVNKTINGMFNGVNYE